LGSSLTSKVEGPSLGLKGLGLGLDLEGRGLGLEGLGLGLGLGLAIFSLTTSLEQVLWYGMGWKVVNIVGYRVYHCSMSSGIIYYYVYLGQIQCTLVLASSVYQFLALCATALTKVVLSHADSI
jgi:hypothetical protein